MSRRIDDRRLRFEQFESRVLLAGDFKFGDVPFQFDYVPDDAVALEIESTFGLTPFPQTPGYVWPSQPTADTAVVLTVLGRWHNGCVPGLLSHSVTEGTVEVQLRYAPPESICTAAFERWQVEVPLGILPPGTFDVTVEGKDIGSFTVIPASEFPRNPLDVNGDSLINARDANDVVDSLNRFGSRELLNPSEEAHISFDTNDDGYLSPIDVLLIANELERLRNQHTSGEYIYDDESMALAQSNSDELFPEELAARFYQELRAIRRGVDGTSDIRHQSQMWRGGVKLELTDEGWSDLHENEFRELEELNIELGAQRIVDNGNSLTISFAAELNPRALATIYEGVSGVLSASPKQLEWHIPSPYRLAYDPTSGVYRLTEFASMNRPGRFWEVVSNGDDVTVLNEGVTFVSDYPL